VVLKYKRHPHIPGHKCRHHKEEDHKKLAEEIELLGEPHDGRGKDYHHCGYPEPKIGVPLQFGAS
jgi:hypothetical protein